MTSLRSSILFVLAFAWLPVAGCHPEAKAPDTPVPPRVVHAGTISPECAPWDGAAYRIVLAAATSCASVPPERLELWVFRGFPIVAGSRVVFSRESDDGMILVCDASGNCAQASHGVIELDRFDEGASAGGAFDATLYDGRTIRGSFAVTWCTSTPLCGRSRTRASEAMSA